MVLRLSVCPSVASQSSVETDERIELFFWHMGFLQLEIRVCPK